MKHFIYSLIPKFHLYCDLYALILDKVNFCPGLGFPRTVVAWYLVLHDAATSEMLLVTWKKCFRVQIVYKTPDSRLWFISVDISDDWFQYLVSRERVSEENCDFWRPVFIFIFSRFRDWCLKHWTDPAFLHLAVRSAETLPRTFSVRWNTPRVCNDMQVLLFCYDGQLDELCFFTFALFFLELSQSYWCYTFVPVCVTKTAPLIS